MGQKVTRTDYEWVTTDEPHRTRRKEILAKYPEIKKLMIPDYRLKYAVLCMVIVQIISAYIMRDADWVTLLLVGYCWGGVINHAMTLAIHELAHNLAFGHRHPNLNVALGIFGNLILGVPYSVVFKSYHLEHHKYQGDDVIDTDIPSRLEAFLFSHSFTKLIWVILQPFFYAIRPILTRPKPITTTQFINIIVQASFNLLIWRVMGWTSLIYLISGTFMAMGLHPVAGHFIAEHYLFKEGFETYSYYGVLNRLTFNVGYHNEHHDFPNIPGTLLPKVRQIAAEFYDQLPSHRSWVTVLWNFITDPAIGPYARVKRQNGTAPPIGPYARTERLSSSNPHVDSFNFQTGFTEKTE